MDQLKLIDDEIKTHRNGINPYRTIDDLPLSEMQKRCVLEWFAWKIWEMFMELGIDDGYGKLYDPLVIEENECHSYVFDLGDGGRHHKYETLAELEERLKREMTERIEGEMEEKIKCCANCKFKDGLFCGLYYITIDENGKCEKYEEADDQCLG